MVYQLMDLFALPEMTLYANVIEVRGKPYIKICCEGFFWKFLTGKESKMSDLETALVGC